MVMVSHNIENNKSKNMVYSAEHYLTTGFFNNYKLYNVDYYHLVFSDTKNAILEVQGMAYKVPHATVKYRIIMQKDNSGVWNVKTLEPLSTLENTNQSN
jgi:acetoacetate decarboxylase